MSDYMDLDAYIEDKIKEIVEKGFVIEHSIKFSSFTPSDPRSKYLYWCNVYLKINQAKYIMERLVSGFDIDEAISNIHVVPDYKIYKKIEFV